MKIVDAIAAPRTGLGRVNPRASLHGNIAVKPAPIRLLALYTVGHSVGRRTLMCRSSIAGVIVALSWLLRRTNRAINRFAFWHNCMLACHGSSEDN